MLYLKSALNILPIFVILTKLIRQSHLQSSPFPPPQVPQPVGCAADAALPGSGSADFEAAGGRLLLGRKKDVILTDDVLLSAWEALTSRPWQP